MSNGSALINGGIISIVSVIANMMLGKKRAVNSTAPPVKNQPKPPPDTGTGPVIDAGSGADAVDRDAALGAGGHVVGEPGLLAQGRAVAHGGRLPVLGGVSEHLLTRSAPRFTISSSGSVAMPASIGMAQAM